MLEMKIVANIQAKVIEGITPAEMKYAKHLEFVFINGTAANDDDIIEAYPRIYMGTRESSNHVELNLIDARNAMEDW